jgi:hypothetical protein
MQWNRRQGLTLILFGLTILTVTTNIIDNTLSPLVGVALMGQAKGKYTFFSLLNGPMIALGYAACIFAHGSMRARSEQEELKNQLTYSTMYRLPHLISAPAANIEI